MARKTSLLPHDQVGQACGRRRTGPGQELPGGCVVERVKPVLYILSGLPGVGKSTLGKKLAKHRNAAFFRIDTIEQGLRDLCRLDVQGEGYRLAYRLVADNLKSGISAVADSCNPEHFTRKEWEEVANSCGCPFLNIEVVCSRAGSLPEVVGEAAGVARRRCCECFLTRASGCGLFPSFSFAQSVEQAAVQPSGRRDILRGLWRLWAWKRWVLAMRVDVDALVVAPTKSATWRPTAALDKARALFSGQRGDEIDRPDSLAK